MEDSNSNSNSNSESNSDSESSENEDEVSFVLPTTLRRSFFKRTRRGQVARLLQERYLRDDLGCGEYHNTQQQLYTL
jgi:hypothetical protein